MFESIMLINTMQTERGKLEGFKESVERPDIYGQPDEAVMEGPRPFSQDGVIVTVTPHFAGFTRLQAGGGAA
jgi:hypothetical protein